MSRTWAVVSREFASFFRTPLGWVVVALFLTLSGLFFQGALRPGEPATLRDFFTVWRWLLLIVSPAISMRLFSEELRTGTIEPLLCAPVSESTLVIGKFFGAFLFLVAMLAPTLGYVLLLEFLSSPDLGPIASGYLGILLLGALYLAVGTFISVLTSSQTLAFLGTLFTLLLVEVAASVFAPKAPPLLSRLLFSLSPGLRIADFARGLVELRHVVFFAGAAAWFLVMGALCLQSRRWR